MAQTETKLEKYDEYIRKLLMIRDTVNRCGDEELKSIVAPLSALPQLHIEVTQFPTTHGWRMNIRFPYGTLEMVDRIGVEELHKLAASVYENVVLEIAEVLCNRGHLLHCLPVFYHKERSVAYEVIFDGTKFEVHICGKKLLEARELYALRTVRDKVYEIYPELLQETLNCT